MVGQAQKASVLADLARLKTEASVLFDGNSAGLVHADAASVCVAFPL
jgi:3,4-dehydroadipyl-CoA semialdehyde dehydrogenase